jgi:hypothetical protein
MESQFNQMPNQVAWAILVTAAKRALEAEGFTRNRVPGRGRSNVWKIERQGKSQLACIRTSKDRWFAFPPLARGTKWKTLGDVDMVITAVVDIPEAPQKIQVYFFDAAEVRKRFDAAYYARTKAGMVVQDNFGMWVNLDEDKRDLPASVGAGLAKEHKPIASYTIETLAKDVVDAELESADADTTEGELAKSSPPTVADIMNQARQHIASLLGVPTEAVKLDLKIEY